MDISKASKQMQTDKHSNQVLMALQAFDISNYYGTLGILSAVVAGSVLYYYLQNNLKSNERAPLIDFKNQTRIVSNRTDGARILSLNKTDNVLACYSDDCKTLYEIFCKAIKISNNGNYLGWKPTSNEPYKWLKYSEVYDLSRKLGSAMIKFGLKPRSGEAFVGIYSRNRPEWVITEQACNMFTMILVPLYDTLGNEAMNFVLNQTELKVIICDDSQKALSLMNFMTKIETIVIIDDINDTVREKAAFMNIKIFKFDEVINIGKFNLAEPVPPNPDDICTICYTSGTTGIPKGAIITHANLVSNSSSMVLYVKRSLRDEIEQERYISYLPLAHMFERISQTTIVSLGGAVGFYEGDIKKLIDNLKEVKPTIFCTVPRLLNRIYAKIMENINNSSPLKRKIFKIAFAQKEKEVLKGINRHDGIWDFAFRQIRESFGGCVKYIITGSAPISPEIFHFLRVVCGCYVLEGFGATETSGASGVQLPGEMSVGNVGPPFLCCMYKLNDVPEMNLVVDRDQKGEILVKGINVFKGYFKNEEKTKEVLDDDGWYHTGDIGIFEDNGCLKIVDRVKNIFKLQQGEYIAPEKIENVYVRCKYVSQIFVYGDSYKSTLVAIVVPEQNALFELAKEKSLECEMESLCKNPVIKEHILVELNKLGKQSDLKSFEQVRNIYLTDELFSVENGLLTPTMKTKRNELKKHFQNELHELYKNLD